MTHRNILTIALAALLVSAGPLAAQQKIGIIDLKKTFDSYWKTKQADSNLKERAGDLDKARKGMIDDYEKANKEYKDLLDKANDQAVAAAERDKRKKSAEDKLLEIRQIEQSVQQFDRQSRTTLAEQQRRLRDNILKEVTDLVNAKAKAKGFTTVIDSAAESVNQTKILIYTSGENDITDEIVKELNASAPAITPAVTPPPAQEKKK
ncbi:MAG TPA: OmpH family outer membrane protein [Verrucomicrobiae bacterium]|jgi:outer membrane protein